MRYLVISDIHADIEAFERVLSHAADKGWERLIFLGDAIGYGTEPEAVVQTLMALAPYAAVKGNHEVAAARSQRPGGSAKRRHGHIEHLSDESLAYLDSLPEHHVDDHWAIVHGSPRDAMEYVISIPAARANVKHMERPIYFVGHTHVASAFIHDETDGNRPWRAYTFRQERTRLSLAGLSAAFVNPGSVSQSRDGINLAAYAIFDEQSLTVEVFRVST